MLRLGDRKPVARDDHLAREREGWTATSSAVVARTVRPSSTCSCSRLHLTESPEEALLTERFIAFAINSVSSVPDAPTSMPATMTNSLPRTGARPVKAFRSEMTTGMSAPLIGATEDMRPKLSANRISSHISHIRPLHADDRDAGCGSGENHPDVEDVWWGT